MNKALILHGNGNTGKSTTIYELIKCFPPKDVIEIKHTKCIKTVIENIQKHLLL